jgi:hypothetical protein
MYMEPTCVLQASPMRTRSKSGLCTGQSYGFNAFFPGDTVAFVHSASMERFANGLVKTVSRLNDRELLLTFEKPVPTTLQDHDCVENMTWTPRY